jgi:anthranilate synthase component 1
LQDFRQDGLRSTEGPGNGDHRRAGERETGLYAGSVGYFSAAGELDSCITLRTALIAGGVMYVQAGAGIVADSHPRAVQQECVDKAKALFRAAEEAKRFAVRSQ